MCIRDRVGKGRHVNGEEAAERPNGPAPQREPGKGQQNAEDEEIGAVIGQRALRLEVGQQSGSDDGRRQAEAKEVVRTAVAHDDRVALGVFADGVQHVGRGPDGQDDEEGQGVGELGEEGHGLVGSGQ